MSPLIATILVLAALVGVPAGMWLWELIKELIH